MKKFLFILFFFFSVSIAFADTDTIEGVATADTDTYEGIADTVTDTFEGQTVSGTATSYVYELKCEDNAANDTIANDGTGGNVETLTADTETITDSTNYQEGSRSFDIDSVTAKFIFADNWTSEEFEVSFYYRPNEATASTYTPLFLLDNDDDFLPDANDLLLYRDNASTGITVYIQGNSGSAVKRTSSNISWTADTWYEVILTVDATANPWVISVKVGGTTATWDGSSWGTGAAVFDVAPFFAGAAATYYARGNVDHFRMEDQE